MNNVAPIVNSRFFIRWESADWVINNDSAALEKLRDFAAAKNASSCREDRLIVQYYMVLCLKSIMQESLINQCGKRFETCSRIGVIFFR